MWLKLIQRLLSDRYFILGIINIAVVNIIVEVGKFAPSEYAVLFFFLSVIAFSFISYLMFKEIDFDNQPSIAISVLKFVQIMIPTQTLLKEGVLLFM
jgi:hypothetical protein